MMRFTALAVAAVFLLPIQNSAKAADSDEELVHAVESRERGGAPNFLAKLEAGGEVRIAYLGGSITAQEGWRPKSLKWFQERFPKAKVSEINAAIGGTGSDLGVFRLQQDVLRNKPDLLFVEFAVNDAGSTTKQIHRSMEGIVRKTWKNDPTTDICFVYTLTGNMLETLKGGRFPRSASAMEVVADHYGIPSIHMGFEVARLEKSGKLIFQGAKPNTDEEKAKLEGKILFSPDSVHPYTDTGHPLYAEAVARAFTKLEKVGKVGGHELRSPILADNWEKATMVPLSRAKLTHGWKPLPPEHRFVKWYASRLPELWQASSPEDSISFRFKGTTARIYDLVGPDCGQVSISVDEETETVKPRFDAYCTYHRLATLSVAEGLFDVVHTVTISVHPEQPDKAKILSQRGKKIDDPKKYDGRSWYAGAILVVGEVVD
jgi:hypothetical protein